MISRQWIDKARLAEGRALISTKNVLKARLAEGRALISTKNVLKARLAEGRSVISTKNVLKARPARPEAAISSQWIDKYGSKLDVTLRKAIASQLHAMDVTGIRKLPIIITFKQKMTKARLLSLKKRLGIQQVTMKNRMKLLNAITANITVNGIRRLCIENCVDCMYLDYKVNMYLDVATPTVGSYKIHKANLTGKGVGIAIIDTGIYPHPDITKPNNRIVAFKDFINKRSRPYDDNGHGTHVAGIAAGNGRMSKGKYRGQATMANLVGLKVLDKDGSGQSSDIIRGIEWVIANRKRYNIRVINLSLGYDGPVKCSDDPLCRVTSKAWKAGLVVVAAAGNNGPRPRTIGTPGNNPAIITVGAVDDKSTIKQSDDQIAKFSSRGKVGCISKPEVVAPGVKIMSLRIPRSYKRLSGTSMAAPTVSGIVALLLQRYPRLKPRQVKSLIIRNAIKLRASRNSQGFGEVSIKFP